LNNGNSSKERRDRCETQSGTSLIVYSDDFRDNGAHGHAILGFQRSGDRIANTPVFQGFDQTAAGRPINRHQLPVVNNEMKLLICVKFAPEPAPIIMARRGFVYILWGRFIVRVGRHGVSFRWPRYPLSIGPEALRLAVTGGLPFRET
jgi:hypothetical protein